MSLSSTVVGAERVALADCVGARAALGSCANGFSISCYQSG